MLLPKKAARSPKAEQVILKFWIHSCSMKSPPRNLAFPGILPRHKNATFAMEMRMEINPLQFRTSATKMRFTMHNVTQGKGIKSSHYRVSSTF